MEPDLSCFGKANKVSTNLVTGKLWFLSAHTCSYMWPMILFGKNWQLTFCETSHSAVVCYLKNGFPGWDGVSLSCFFLIMLTTNVQFANSIYVNIQVKHPSWHLKIQKARTNTDTSHQPVHFFFFTWACPALQSHNCLELSGEVHWWVVNMAIAAISTICPLWRKHSISLQDAQMFCVATTYWNAFIYTWVFLCSLFALYASRRSTTKSVWIKIEKADPSVWKLLLVTLLTINHLYPSYNVGSYAAFPPAFLSHSTISVFMFHGSFPSCSTPCAVVLLPLLFYCCNVQLKIVGQGSILFLCCFLDLSQKSLALSQNARGHKKCLPLLLNGSWENAKHFLMWLWAFFPACFPVLIFVGRETQREQKRKKCGCLLKKVSGPIHVVAVHTSACHNLA